MHGGTRLHDQVKEYDSIVEREMRNMKLFSIVILLIALLGPGLASAADFDGSKVLICAPVEAIDCAPGESCRKGIPADAGLPAFIRVDIAKMVMIGQNELHRSPPSREANNRSSCREPNWVPRTIALDQHSGEISGSLVNREEVCYLRVVHALNSQAMLNRSRIKSEPRVLADATCQDV